MKHFSKRLFTCAMLALFAFPFSALAHASPILYTPESSAVIKSAPNSVSIKFSERLDGGASVITVTGPSGKTVSADDARVSPDDPRLLSVSIEPDGEGTYFVSWGVVSKDDGHFTKGAYAFGVGEGVAIPPSPTDAEMVYVSSAPEAAAMTMELFGNGVVWALLLIFIFGARPLLNSGKFPSEERLIRRGYAYVLGFAVSLILVGGVLQFAIKAESLATLHGIGFSEAWMMYLGTVSGFATAARIAAAAGVFVLYFLGRSSIFTSKRITLFEVGMVLLMCAFAFFRAIVSHATANPFLPELSIAVNFIHLIEKDIWAGALFLLALLLLWKPLYRFFTELLPRVFTMLTANLMFLSLTASYIVWLHLKSFGNLFATAWGEAFLNLLIVAVLLVAVRTYHVFARAFRPGLFGKALPATLGAELALAVLLIFYSSVVIVTSPPLSEGNVVLQTLSNQGVSVSLERPGFDDAAVLLSTSARPTVAPTVWLSGASGSEPILLHLEKRFPGGYSFPASLLSGEGPFVVSAIVPQVSGYDVRAEFKITQEELGGREAESASRPFNGFTVVMIGIALGGALFGLLVFFVSKREAEIGTRPGGIMLMFFFGFIVTLLLVHGAVNAFAASGLQNPYKRECTDDGNMWHAMLPMREGVPTSAVPQEGCMWGMGEYQYMFPDRREYKYYKNLGEATATLSGTEHLHAGAPAKLTVSIKNADNEPALLFTDMEKLVHMVIVGEDQSEFAHIHADDFAPLSEEAIRTSTFEFAHTFPKAGRYLISLDYAHGITLGSKQFEVQVVGATRQSQTVARYERVQTRGDYEVKLGDTALFAGEIATLRFSISKNGEPVTDIEPYLSAASHIAIVKNDLSVFLHTHGEYHPPGVPYPAPIVKNGKVVHSMAAMATPARFGPDVDAHVIFPEAGVYTLWAQFKLGGEVVAAPFTIRVE